MRRILLVLVLVATTLIATPPAGAQATGAVVISEIFYNPDGQAEGHEFVELHNTGATPVDVSGWAFLSGVSFVFPAGSVIEANSFVVLAQNAVDFEAVFGFAPTGDFSGNLTNGGENLTLVDAGNVIVDQVIYDDVAPWPLSADGDGDSLVSIDASLPADDPARWVAGTPTPQVANDPILTVNFSVQRGWFSQSQVVTLTPSIPGAAIRFNTDGSGVATSEYTGPITVTDNGGIQVIQAQASRTGEAGALITHSYVFRPDTGAPVVTVWPNGLAVAPGEDELTRSFEFIAPPSTGLTPAWGNAGVSASEGGIDAGESDKLFFRGAYGNGTLTANLFGDFFYGVEPTRDIDQLFLRNNQGDPTHLRQIFAHDALLATGQLSPHGRFVSYYRDGQDQGVRHLQERPEGGFMESYTGIDKDQWLAWSTHETIPGSGTSNGLGAATLGAPFASWADAERAIDTDSLIDYLLVQWQAKVSDYRNIKNFRIAGPIDFRQAFDPYRYHFFNWDLDLGYANDQYGRGGPTGWGWAGYVSPDFIAHELAAFVEFRFRASDRITCAHFDDGPLSAAAFGPRLEARRQQLVAAGGADESSFVSGLNTWIAQRNAWLLDEYRSPGADTTVYGTFRPDRPPWKPDTDFTGPLLQQDLPVSVSVGDGVLSIANPNGAQVYYRIDGGDPRQPDGTLSPQAIPYDGPASMPAGRVAVIARSFDAQESDVFQAWSPACDEARNFDVAVSGEPGTSPGAGLVINELQYHALPFTVDEGQAEFVELVNTTDAPINASGFRFDRGIDFTFPPGTTIGPGEFVLLVPQGATVAFQAEYNDALSLAYVQEYPVEPTQEQVDRWAYDPIGTYTGQLDDGGETIRLVDAVGGLIDEVDYGDAAPWPALADGNGPSLVLLDPALDNALAESWSAGRRTGTPGRDNLALIVGDVDCDSLLTVVDALIIAQYTVGLRQESRSCGGDLGEPGAPPTIYTIAADPDRSGAIDVIDALVVAQCSVGLDNGFCG